MICLIIWVLASGNTDSNSFHCSFCDCAMRSFQRWSLVVCCLALYAQLRKVACSADIDACPENCWSATDSGKLATFRLAGDPFCYLHIKHPEDQYCAHPFQMKDDPWTAKFADCESRCEQLGDSSLPILVDDTSRHNFKHIVNYTRDTFLDPTRTENMFWFLLGMQQNGSGWSWLNGQYETKDSIAQWADTTIRPKLEAAYFLHVKDRSGELQESDFYIFQKVDADNWGLLCQKRCPLPTTTQTPTTVAPVLTTELPTQPNKKSESTTSGGGMTMWVTVLCMVLGMGCLMLVITAIAVTMAKRRTEQKTYSVVDNSHGMNEPATKDYFSTPIDTDHPRSVSAARNSTM